MYVYACPERYCAVVCTAFQKQTHYHKFYFYTIPRQSPYYYYTIGQNVFVVRSGKQTEIEYCIVVCRSIA